MPIIKNDRSRFERIRVPKMHLANERWLPVCGQRYDAMHTDKPEEVTCERCHLYIDRKQR